VFWVIPFKNQHLVKQSVPFFQKKTKKIYIKHLCNKQNFLGTEAPKGDVIYLVRTQVAIDVSLKS